MASTEEKACKYLFIRCFILQILFNICFTVLIFNTVASLFSDEDFIMIGLILGGIQIVLSFFIGFYLRRRYKSILIRDEVQRKKYARIAVMLFILIVWCFVNLNAVDEIHMTMIDIAHALFGLRYSFTVYDFFSLGICLCTVFMKGRWIFRFDVD